MLNIEIGNAGDTIHPKQNTLIRDLNYENH